MSKTTKILKRILETVWLIVALIALGIAVKETFAAGIKDSAIYYLFSGIACFFYFSRRRQRAPK